MVQGSSRLENMLDLVDLGFSNFYGGIAKRVHESAGRSYGGMARGLYAAGALNFFVRMSTAFDIYAPFLYMYATTKATQSGRFASDFEETLVYEILDLPRQTGKLFRLLFNFIGVQKISEATGEAMIAAYSGDMWLMRKSISDYSAGFGFLLITAAQYVGRIDSGHPGPPRRDPKQYNKKAEVKVTDV